MPRRKGISPEQTRTSLIEAGIAEFAHKGFAGVTTRELAARAGVTFGALHHHFGTKLGLYEACLKHGNAVLERDVYSELLTSADFADINKQLRHAVTYGFDFVAEHGDLAWFIIRSSMEHPTQPGRARFVQQGPFLTAAASVLTAYNQRPIEVNMVRAAAATISLGRFVIATPEELMFMTNTTTYEDARASAIEIIGDYLVLTLGRST